MPSRQTLRFSGGNREDKENRGSTSMVTMIQEDSDDDGPILYRDDDDDEMEDEGKQNFAFPFPFLIRACNIDHNNEKKFVKNCEIK